MEKFLQRSQVYFLSSFLTSPFFLEVFAMNHKDRITTGVISLLVIILLLAALVLYLVLGGKGF